MQQQNWNHKIRKRAYEIYLERGDATGSEVGDWLQAEQEVEAGRESAIDESSEESFPASDPPAL